MIPHTGSRSMYLMRSQSTSSSWILQTPLNHPQPYPLILQELICVAYFSSASTNAWDTAWDDGEKHLSSDNTTRVLGSLAEDASDQLVCHSGNSRFKGAGWQVLSIAAQHTPEAM